MVEKIKKIVKSIHFKMLDKRWRYKKYPSWTKRKNVTYGRNGCGPTTAAIIDSAAHPDVLPTDIGDAISRMNQGATAGGATYWEAEKRSLRDKGWKVIDCRTMTQFLNLMWEYHLAGLNPYGLLDLWGSKGGKTWTGGGKNTGHYVPATAIRIVKGLYEMYIKDPGPRQTNGWAGYIKHMKGHVKLAAVCIHPELKDEIAVPVYAEPVEPVKPKSDKYTGKLPVLPTVLEKVAVRLAYPLGTPKSIAKFVGGKPKPEYDKALKKNYPDRSKWGARPRAGASCDVFSGTCVREAGIDPKFPRGLREQGPHLKKYFERVKTRKGGDIGFRTGHIAIYVELKGRLYRAQAHYGTKSMQNSMYGVIEADKAMDRYYRPKYKASYLSKGDTFTGVLALQKFLEHYSFYTGAIDCSFGPKTDKAVKAYQKRKGLMEDGKVGVKTLAKMAEDCK